MFVVAQLSAVGLSQPGLMAQEAADSNGETEVVVQVGGNVFFRYHAGLLANVPTESNKSATFDVVIAEAEGMFTHFMLSTSMDYGKATRKTIVFPLNGEKTCMQVQREMKRHDNFRYVETNEHCVSGKALAGRDFAITHTYRSRHKNPPTKFGAVKIPDGKDETLTLEYEVRLSDRKHNEAFFECSAHVRQGSVTFSSLLMNGKWAKSQAKVKAQPLDSCLWSRL